MKLFRDTNGLEWTISVTVQAVKNVRDVLKFDLLDLTDGKSLERLMDDPVLLCDVLYVLCKDQCGKRGLSDAQFGESLAGDALDSATEALLDELVAFFPPRKRLVLAKALATVRTIAGKMEARAMAELDNPEIWTRIESCLTPGGSSTISPPSADSIQPDSLSAN